MAVTCPLASRLMSHGIDAFDLSKLRLQPLELGRLRSDPLRSEERAGLLPGRRRGGDLRGADAAGMLDDGLDLNVGGAGFTQRSLRLDLVEAVQVLGADPVSETDERAVEIAAAQNLQP